ncbi:MAG: hypothetical protein K6F99_06980 [Lachnospiraceae bacterium]|nr:hypothetical protein [Lachnospiraceae bacterium]
MNDNIDEKRINMDFLDNVTGGVGSNEDPQANGKCRCGAYLQKTPYGYHCNNCDTYYDKNKKPLDNTK